MPVEYKVGHARRRGEDGDGAMRLWERVSGGRDGGGRRREEGRIEWTCDGGGEKKGGRGRRRGRVDQGDAKDSPVEGTAEARRRG